MSADPTHFSQANAYLPSIAIGGTPGADRASAPVAPGDMNLDGVVHTDDIADFTFGLTDPAVYLARFGVPASLVGDTDGDGDLDYDDIWLFATSVDSLATTAFASAVVATRGDVAQQRTMHIDRFFQQLDQATRPHAKGHARSVAKRTLLPPYWATDPSMRRLRWSKKEAEFV